MIPLSVVLVSAQQLALVHEPVVEVAPSLEPIRAAEPTSGYDDGFFLRSEDGANELVVEGLFQVLLGLYSRDREPSSDVELKRFRPEFGGRLARVLRFKLETKFTENDVELEEAWVGTELCGGSSILRIGRYKGTFGLEELRSRRYIDFPFFSILNQFSPAEDHGVFLEGTTESGRYEYGLGLYNGTGASDTTSSKDVSARFMVHPFADQPSRGELQLGLAATIGSQQLAIGGNFIEGGAGLDLVQFAPGVMLDGQRLRVGFEGAWFRGPWFCQGELLHVSEELSLPGIKRDVAYDGGYITISRSLTGEDKSFRGVTSDQPYDFERGRGRGAWTTALRYSQLHLDSDLQRFGFAVPGRFTDRIDTWSLALNWFPNRFVVLRNALVWSDYADRIALPDGGASAELSFVTEVQMHF